MAEKERRGRKRSCLVVIWIPYSYRQTRHLFTEAGDDNKVGSEDKLGKISRWTNYHHQYFTVPISNQSHIRRKQISVRRRAAAATLRWCKSNPRLRRRPIIFIMIQHH